MKLLLIVSTVLVTGLADRLEEKFDQFRTEFGKHYDSRYSSSAGNLYSLLYN